MHISVVERIVQAPRGYAPGNLPPRVRLIATEDDPQVRLEELARAIEVAHGPDCEVPLVRRNPAWMRVGLMAYLIFIAGTAGALLRALYVAASASLGGGEPLGQALGELTRNIPMTVAAAVWSPLATYRCGR